MKLTKKSREEIFGCIDYVGVRGEDTKDERARWRQLIVCGHFEGNRTKEQKKMHIVKPLIYCISFY